MGASGLRDGRHHWTGTGKERSSVNLSCISDRSSGKSIGWSGSGCDDDGSRNYGIHAGGCRTFAIIPCSDGLCDYRGATAFSHVNDSGFWLVSSLLEIDEKTTLKSWTMMETIIGFTGLICALIISIFA